MGFDPTGGVSNACLDSVATLTTATSSPVLLSLPGNRSLCTIFLNTKAHGTLIQPETYQTEIVESLARIPEGLQLIYGPEWLSETTRVRGVTVSIDN